MKLGGEKMMTAQELFKLSKKDKNQLEQNYIDALQDREFHELVDSLNVSSDILKNYTSLLKDVIKEKKNCKNCPSLEKCPNKVKGYIEQIIVLEKGLNFAYVNCPLEKERLKNSAHQKWMMVYDMPKEIKRASLNDVYKTAKNRIPIIKYFKTFLDDYQNIDKPKGIYLHGSFGSGKTYLIAALFNELAKKEVRSAMVYFPEFLRELKASFGTDFKERFDYIKEVPLLLLDDIGAENVTSWSRDEILGPILQYRMEEGLSTFFTSNLTLEELEVNLASTKSGNDSLKARRIIERIRQLTVDYPLIGENFRR